MASNVAVAAAFAPIGIRFALRRVEGPDRAALLAFASWWLLFAAQSAMAAARVGLVAAGSRDASLHEALFVAENTASVLSLWGLAAYVSYLRTGTTRGWLAWGLALAALAGYYAFVVLSHDIVAVDALRWKTSRTFAEPIGPIEQAALAASYYGLLIGLAIAFSRLVRRAGTPEAKRRVRAMAWSLAVVAVVGFIGLGFQGDSPIGPLAGVLRIGAVALVWVAYFPPRSAK